MSIVLVGSTSGSITLQEPAVAGTTTLNLPATSGTLMVNGPAFRAIRTTSQSVSHGTYTKVQSNTETFDTANCYDNSTNYRFTPNVAGYYQVNGMVSIQVLNATTQVNQVLLYKNGSVYNAKADLPSVQIINATGWGEASVSLSDIVYLNGSTDNIELYTYFFDYTSGTSKNLVSSQFSAVLVRGA